MAERSERQTCSRKNLWTEKLSSFERKLQKVSCCGTPTKTSHSSVVAQSSCSVKSLHSGSNTDLVCMGTITRCEILCLKAHPNSRMIALNREPHSQFIQENFQIPIFLVPLQWAKEKNTKAKRWLLPTNAPTIPSHIVCQRQVKEQKAQWLQCLLHST